MNRIPFVLLSSIGYLRHEKTVCRFDSCSFADEAGEGNYEKRERREMGRR
jgi:hypothetical protein